MKSGGRLWCISAIDEATPVEHLAQLGSTMERFADTAIVTSTLENKRRFLSASHHVLDGVEHCAAFRLVADRHRALEWAISAAGPQDTIVLFTNERNQTAQQQRTDIDQIARSVEQIRDAARNPHQGPATHLTIFG